jgi:hypothetical protein
MESSQSVLSSDRRNERDFILDELKQLQTPDKDHLFDGLSRAPNLGHDSSDQRIGIVPEDSAGLRLVEPPIHASPSRRPRGLKNDQLASDRPSLGRRMFRSLARFLIVALIGAGVTLAWQSYGDEAKERAKDMVRARVPSLAWLLPVSTMKSSPTGQVTPGATITSPELAQQLKPMAIDLALVRRSVEELAAQQTQMARSLTTLQAVEQDISQKTLQAVGQDIRQKLSSPPPSRAVPVPPRTNATRVAAPQPAAQSSSVQSSSVQSSSVSSLPLPGQPYLPELDLSRRAN